MYPNIFLWINIDNKHLATSYIGRQFGKILSVSVPECSTTNYWSYQLLTIGIVVRVMQHYFDVVYVGSFVPLTRNIPVRNIPRSWRLSPAAKLKKERTLVFIAYV